MSEKPAKVIPEKVIGYQLPNTVQSYKPSGPILYALGIGFSTDPLNKTDLTFTYELNDEFRVFPTYATSFLDISAVGEAVSNCPGLPEFNPMQLLHGMHTLEFHKPLKAEATYYQKAYLEDIQDKEKGALLLVRFDSFEDKEYKSLAVTNKMFLFIRGLGGYDPQKKHKPLVSTDFPPIPKTAPTFATQQGTTKNQALIFRLNGDFNPLHADPSMAEVGGFPAPILHGLCTYGITAKLAIEKASDYDLTAVEKVSTKFVGHIFPGETISLKGWLSSDQKTVIFEANVVERNKQIAVGFVVFKKQLKPKL